VSSTSYVSVAVATLTDVNETSLIWVPAVTSGFQAPAASADTVEGQWALYLSTATATAGSVLTGSTRKVWEGVSNGLTFQTVGTIQKAANDLEQILDHPSLPPVIASSVFTGSVYLHLVLKVTTGGGGSINLVSGVGTQISATTTG
jgi:hypothetical protein